MTIEVINAVFHAIQKPAAEHGALTAIERTETLDADDALTALVEKLHTTFNAKATKGFAHFKAECAEDGFAAMLSQYLQDQPTFLPFSARITKRLADVMSANQIVESGVLFVCHYQVLTRPYLLLMLISQSESYRVDENLALRPTQHLDIDKLQLVARVDIDAAKEIGAQPPLAFLKGRVGRQVADFFLEFLEGEVRQDPKANGKALVQAIDSFSQQAQLNSEERAALGKTTLEYCKERTTQGEMVELAELSRVIDEQAGYSGFAETLAEKEEALPELLTVTPSALKELSKFSGQGKGISLSFDRRLLGDAVQFEPDSGRVIINQLPPNLLDQLMRAVKSSSN